MKGSILAIVAVAASFTSAQFVGVPACAQACISSAIASVGCQAGDVGCQCSSTSQIAGVGAGCIIGSCTAAGDLQSAITGGNALCANYLATATATGSSELTTTLKSTTTATSTVIVQTTDIPAPTGFVTNGTIAGTASITRAPTSTSSRAGTASTTSASVPPNAGAKLGVGLGGVGALFVAFFAL